MVEWDPLRGSNWQVYNQLTRQQYLDNLEKERAALHANRYDRKNKNFWMSRDQFVHYLNTSTRSIWASKKNAGYRTENIGRIWRAYKLYRAVARYFHWRYHKYSDPEGRQQFETMIAEQHMSSSAQFIEKTLYRATRYISNKHFPTDLGAYRLIEKLAKMEGVDHGGWPRTDFDREIYRAERHKETPILAPETHTEPPSPKPIPAPPTDPTPQERQSTNWQKILTEKTKQWINYHLADEDRIRKLALGGEGADDGGGLTVPGYNYVGPGNPVPAGAPRGPVDQAALRHDQRYQWLLHLGDLPYLLSNEADKMMSQELQNTSDTGWFDKLLANAVRALWKSKETLSEWALPESLEPIAHGTKHESDLHPQGEPQPKRPRLDNEEDLAPTPPPPSPLQEPDVSSSEQESPATATGPTTAAPGAAMSTPADAAQGGGGGGPPKCGGTFWGGSSFRDGILTTRQTRRVATHGDIDTYKPTRSMSATPEVIVTTPWQFIDLNKFSCHISPANFQELIETSDGFRPVRMKIKIHELVFKDITIDSSQQASVQDSQSGMLLITEDSNYDFPYPMGGGQHTTPGHLPGELYTPPLYAYRTHGRVRKITEQNWAFPFMPSSHSELFLLENQNLQILHGGDCFEQTYTFPDLPFQPFTQYPWDARREDNPISQQRLVVLNKDKESDGLGGIQVNKDAIGKKDFVFLSNRLPANWLANPRFQDGDLIHANWKDLIPGKNGERAAGARPNQEPPRIVVRDTAQYGVYTKYQTFQPGPGTVDNSVVRPEGDIVITSNALVALDEDEGVFGPYQKIKDPDGRLFLLEQIGHSAPTDPLHVRNAELDSEKGTTYNPGMEIQAPLFPGSLLEGASPGLESQIWQRIPNTQFGAHLPEMAPMAMWSMSTPPPTVFFRHLRPLAPPTIVDGAPVPIPGFVMQYVQFLLSYEIEWETLPRQRGTKRWNPAPPPIPPQGYEPDDPVYNLIFDAAGNVKYNKPSQVWMLRQRPRFRR